MQLQLFRFKALGFRSQKLIDVDKMVINEALEVESLHSREVTDENDETETLFFDSSVSARKLKCPSSARLGIFVARLGSSWKILARAHHY